MKYADIQRLHDAGLISSEQRQKIIEHFGLKEDGGKLLAILSFFGAVLISCGIALLVAAHWNEIPRGIKIAAGLGLMAGAHALGYWLREVQGKYRKTGEALHFAGSCLFLANIALIGQVYNLSSRPPNALFAWCIGIAALPWLLRSKAQLALFLTAVVVWFGFEANADDSWLYCHSERQVLLYAALGAIYIGFGWLLRGGSFADFASVAEGYGLTIFLCAAFPLTWRDFMGHSWHNDRHAAFPVLAGAAVLLMALGANRIKTLDKQWRWTWFGALAGMIAVMATVWLDLWYIAGGISHDFFWHNTWGYVPGTIALFLFCLLQIQVGLHERSSLQVNLGIVFIALDIIAAYCDLFGSMARTGAMFVVGGAGMIGFGIFLEKKRRTLMRRIQTSTPGASI